MKTRFFVKAKNSTFLVANGGSLQVHGLCMLPMSIGEEVFIANVIVADLTKLDGILGMDFLKKNRFSQDFFSGKLFHCNTVIQLHGKRDKCCCNLKLCKHVTVNPGEGVTVECVLSESENWDSPFEFAVAES